MNMHDGKSALTYLVKRLAILSGSPIDFSNSSLNVLKNIKKNDSIKL